MPELPEVETTRRGIEPHLAGQRISAVIVRESRLRWPVPPMLEQQLRGQCLRAVERRAKYLLLRFDSGTVLLHLGMSGSLRVIGLPAGAPRKHDHLDLVFEHQLLRLHDPRRFGACLWVEGDPQQHELLRALGPEPLLGEFDGEYLYRKARGRRGGVKQFLMDGRIVVGVGNIYANEALFVAGIRPQRAAGRVSLVRFRLLADAIRSVLGEAIRVGGTTLRDYVDENGAAGYFSQQLLVYGRGGQECRRCHGQIQVARAAQRATFYCPGCQR